MDDALTGVLLSVLLEAVLIAVPLSYGLLTAYRRAVVRRIKAIRTGLEVGVNPSGSMIAGDAQSDVVHIDGDGAQVGEEVYREMTVRSVAYRRAIILGGIAYGLVMAVIAASIAGGIPNLTQILVLTTVFGFSGVLIAQFVAGRTSRRVMLTGYALLLLAASIVAFALSTDFGFFEAFLLWAIFCVPPTVLALAVTNSRIVAVGPLVFAFAVMATGGANTLLFVMNQSTSLLEAVSSVASAIGLNAIATFILIIVVGFGILGIAAWFVLRWVGRAYSAKATSSSLLVADSIMLIFLIIQGLIVLARDMALFPLLILAFGAYWLVSRVVLRSLRKRVLSGLSRHLLVLRPFSLGHRHARLFGTVTRAWRFIGSVQVIVGPDLTSETVEPDEFLDFISRKLDRHFVSSSKPVDEQLEKLDFVPDADGRYRVNQVLCYSDIWRQVFVGLAERSHVFMMDLRGYTSGNEGTTYEIQTVCRRIPLNKVLFLVDETTESEVFRSAVDEILAEAEDRSPNLGRTFEELSVLELSKAANGDVSLFPLLCRLAA